MSETETEAGTADRPETVEVSHREFRTGLPAGRFRIVVDPAKARKYVLLTTNTQDVISYDLQQRIDDEYFNKVSGAVTPPQTK